MRDAAGQAVIIGAGAGFETREHHNSFNLVELDTANGRGRVQFYKYLPDHNHWKKDTDVNPLEDDGSFYFNIGRAFEGGKTMEATAGEISEKRPTSERRIDVKDSRVGVIGDHAKIDGGIHFHGKDDPQKLCLRYLNDLASETNNLPWASLDPDHADPSRGESLGLADIYTSLDTTELERMETEDQVREYLVRQKEARRISAQEMLNIHKKLVLLGDPGSGKSTFVNFLTHVMAQAGRAENPAEWLSRLKKTGPWDHDVLFPIRVILRDFAAALSNEVRGGAERLLSYLNSTLEPSGLSDFWSEIYDGLVSTEQPYLILLDGLDEVPSELRERVVRTIDNFAEKFRHNRYLVTCRIYAYIGQNYQLKGFQQATLTPFSREQIESFIEAWYHELSLRGRFTKQEADTRAARLKQAASRSDLIGLAERPLLMTVMALLHTFRGQLPDDRVELYQWTVDLLMRRWDARVSGEKGLLETLNLPGLKMNNLEAGLYEVAFHVHSRQGNEGAADITEETLLKVLKSYLGGSWDIAEKFVNYVRERTGLLIRHKPGAYRFPHRTFQEYMAASHLVVGTLDYPLEASRLVQQDPDRWRIVFILAAGHAARTHRQGQAIASVTALCPKRILEVPDAGASGFQIANIAGEALLEIGQVDEKCKPIGDAALVCVREWLLAAMDAHELLSPEERVASGNILSQIGDPRFDPENWYLPGDELVGFIKIPAGPFLMGTAAEDAEGLRKELPDYLRGIYKVDREIPQHRVELSEYSIGKYPVTVSQFRVFLQESGHKELKGWENWNRFGNHPTVDVSWHDATAYCEWLTERFKDRGWRVQLPTEAQWERAARGTKGRKYPWGAEKIDPNRANYYETGINTTSPVGCFPGGISPCGAMDMIGNADEWCRDWYQDDYYAKSPSRNPSGPSKGSNRVIRGGSWDSGAGYCRSASRDSNDPGGRDGNLGFRLVLLPGQQG
jgi:formylglycine-generating enzyme required for sulfatase activity/energy-coupling factor transporter ATP-binding protein EcfA2